MTTSYAGVLAALLAGMAVLAWPVARRPRDVASTRPTRVPTPGRRRIAGPAHPTPGAGVTTTGVGTPVVTRPVVPRPVVGVPVVAVPVVAVPVVVELVAAALSAGLPPADALAATVRAAGPSAAPLSAVVDALRLGTSVERAWQRAGPAYASLGLALVLADRTGASAAAALRRTAADERAARRRRAHVAARALGVRLVLPLGLATLPSFALLAVVPVLLGLATRLLSV